VKAPITTTLVLAAAAGLAGCGGDDEQQGEPIPAESAAALEAQLESIENRFEFGGDACADITGNEDPNTTAVESVLNSLPRNVDADVRDSLEQSFERLFQLVEEQCDAEEGEEAETTPEPEPLPPPETDTEPTETVPPEEDEEETVPPEEETSPEVPPGQNDEPPPGQGGEIPGQGGGGGAVVPGEDG
jgi:hypothetical protein